MKNRIKSLGSIKIVMNEETFTNATILVISLITIVFSAIVLLGH